MSIRLVVPMRTEADWRMYHQLNEWCIKHRVNLYAGENPGYLSLLFTGSSTAIYQLQTYLKTLNLQG